MADYDVVIIGGGPAGLTAGIRLRRANRKTLLLEKESFGGYLMSIERVEDYPGFPEGISGAELGSQMVDQAYKFGLKMEQAEVIGLEIFSSSKWISCAGGKGFSAEAIIIAGGLHWRKLGVPGEEHLTNKGLFSCAVCDAWQFVDKPIAVYGGGDDGVTDALYLTKTASKVNLLDFKPKLSAAALLQEKVANNPKIEVSCETRIEAILGEEQISGIEIRKSGNAKTEVLPVAGLLVHIGRDPSTDYLDGVVELDDEGKIVVSSNMETDLPGVFSAGDIRSGSPKSACNAVGDGATAAYSAIKYLESLGK